jgi:hypothetical protein
VKRGVFDLLRRGFDNTIANWQLSLIRFLEAFVFMALAVGAVFVMLVPIMLSLGIQLTELDTPEEFEGVIEALTTKWATLIWIFIGVSVLLLLFVIIHSFVEAGCARVLVDADRVAGPEIVGTRSRYRIFSWQRWVAGAKAGIWPVFWIYNAIWGVASLIILIPLLPTIAAMFAFRGEEGLAVLAGCLGLLVTFAVAMLVAIVCALVTNRAIVSWAAHHTGAVESMRIGWQAIKGDLARHLLTALAIMVVGMAGSMFFASFSMFAGIGESMGRGDVFLMMTLPLRLLGSLLNSAFSAVLGSWFIATYAGIATDHR